MKPKALISLITCGAVAALATSCGGKDKPESAGTGGTSGPGLPASVVSTTAPEGAIGVVDARTKAKPGETIVLRGKVGGKITPISETAAILVLADEKAIKSCDQIPGDGCETPWDYCCVESSTIAASTATIQVKGEDGKVLRTTLRGAGDLKELSHLIVTGTVDAASTPAALIVNADRIHVEKP